MNMSHLIIGGAGVCLLVGIVAVFLESAFDAGFEDGFEQGRATARKEVSE